MSQALQTKLRRESKSGMQKAAVLIALTSGGLGAEVVLTQRSPHLNSHAGEVSFPGGKWEPGDTNLTATALRESHEEVGLPPEKVQVMGCMKTHYTRRKISVLPVVGVINPNQPLVANPDELTSIFRVPLAFFLADQRTRTDVFVAADKQHWAPVWHYDGYEIWGFTARVLANFMNIAFDAQLSRDNTAPERLWSGSAV